MKAAHIPKVERRLRVAIETLLPERTVRGDVEASGDRLRRLLTRLDSAEFDGKGRPGTGWRSAVRDIVELLDVDVPDLIDAVRQAQGAQRKYCRYCGERRLGLLAASPDDHGVWECRDEDGCDFRKAAALPEYEQALLPEKTQGALAEAAEPGSSGRPEPGQGNPAMPDNAYGITLAWRRLGQDIMLAGFATEDDRAAVNRLLAFAAALPEYEQARLPEKIQGALAEAAEPGSSDRSEQDPYCEHGPGACPPDCDCRCDTCMRRMELGESPGRPEPGLVTGTAIHAQIEAFGPGEMAGSSDRSEPDPDAMLAAQRQAIQDWEQAGKARDADEAAERATSAAAALDDWLSHGGGLPDAWCNALRPPGRPEPDPGTAPVALLRFYDDDHGPSGSHKAGAGVTTLVVPAGTDELTVELVLPEPEDLSDAAVLDAAGRLLHRYLPRERAMLAMRMVQEAARLAGQHSGEQEGTQP